MTENATIDAAQWRQHRQVFERLLDAALTAHELPRRARRYRLHGGTAHELRLQVWSLPAPSGHRVLATLTTLLAETALFAPHDIHIVAEP